MFNAIEIIDNNGQDDVFVIVGTDDENVYAVRKNVSDSIVSREIKGDEIVKLYNEIMYNSDVHGYAECKLVTVNEILEMAKTYYKEEI